MPRKTALCACLLLIPAALLLLPLPALAAKWVAIGSRGGAQIEIDASSLNRVGDETLRIWHRESHAKPRTPDSGAFSYSRLTLLSEFQCAKRLAAPLQRIYGAADGSEIKSETFDGKEANPILPDSIGEAVFTYACKRKKAPAPAALASAPVDPAPAVEPSKPAAKKGKAGKNDAPPPPPPHAHWEYEGKAGPGKWGKLSEDYALCGTGQRQSPIDIRDTIPADLPPLRFSYKPVPLSIVDNGHTIQINAAGAGGISVEGEDYELLQFHFHKPSEEKINGKAYDMVAHLVHKAKDGRLAVIAVLLQAGKEQRLIRTLWNNLPLEQHKTLEKAEIKIDPAQLLPATGDYITYIGSLTTPPCSEGVLWLVLKTPTQISKEQIGSFGKIYKNNARPIQPHSGRVMKASR
ncbi:MAG: carbonic anhydrase family protein [Rhodocyclaceae bacterium]